jgi:nitrate/TMAO reductase-like tetraheme cytochrome c subunit
MVCLAAAGCNNWSSPAVSASPLAPPAEQAQLITIPDIFHRLERPPVRFAHDKHTHALEPEGCKVCHRTDDQGNFLFTYLTVAEQTDRNAWMNVYHDNCIGCHTRRTEEGKKAGPVTCGECHVIEREYPKHQYLPVMPDYYEVLRDTYHSNCIACHRKPSKVVGDAGALDWQGFYVKHKKTAAPWPKVTFDYLWHEKHEKALAGKCERCHTISPQKLEELKAKGTAPANRDWVWDVDENKSLTERITAHARCINCHLQRKAAQAGTAGPTDCGKCHSGANRTIKELADVVRPQCGQQDTMLIELDQGACAKAVAFNHQSHVAHSRSCQECHHKTLRPCGDCHTVEGSQKGNWITLAEAHHEVSSSLSCIGCHEAEKRKADCAGCHQFLPHGLVRSRCSGCHTGSLDGLQTLRKLPAPEELIPTDVKEKLEISRIENEYRAASMPHLAMARRLTEISNKSLLASYFHQDPMTVCAGCHHLGPLEAKADVPSCATCHTARPEPGSSTPTLMGAYHQRCLGCHHRMDPTGRAMPQTCTGCHEEKVPGGKHRAAQQKE